MGLVAPLAALTLVLGPAANGTTVSLHRGEALVVRLPGNPTTGYRWSAVRVPASLRRVSSQYVAPKPGRVGEGGTYVFRFRAVTGAGKLTLAYARPWEHVRPLRSFVLILRVR